MQVEKKLRKIRSNSKIFGSDQKLDFFRESEALCAGLRSDFAKFKSAVLDACSQKVRLSAHPHAVISAVLSAQF